MDSENYSKNTNTQIKNLSENINNIQENKDNFEIEEPEKNTETKNFVNPTLEKEIEKKKIKKGVCYLSRIPPGMRVQDMRHYFRNYDVERIYFKSKEKKISKKKKRNYSEGYIEFKTKKDAKMVALIFNGKQMGGKKRSKFYDDILCIKYMRNLKWMDLLDKKNSEKKIREKRIQTEIEEVNKIHNFIVGKKMNSKKILKILKKKVGDFKKDNSGGKKKDFGVLDNGFDKSVSKGKIFEDRKKEFNGIVVDQFLNKKNRFFKKKPLEKNIY